MAVYFAGRVLFTSSVVRQANETVELYDSKIKLLEEERDESKVKIADLERRLGILEELVTRSAAVDVLTRTVEAGFAGLHARLDRALPDSVVPDDH